MAAGEVGSNRNARGEGDLTGGEEAGGETGEAGEEGVRGGTRRGEEEVGGDHSEEEEGGAAATGNGVATARKGVAD